MKDWEIKNKNNIKKKESQQIPAEKADYVYQRCLNLEHKLFEMEANLI